MLKNGPSFCNSRYGGMFHAVVANNMIERAQGLIVEGLNHGKSGSYTYVLAAVCFVYTADN